MLGVRIRRRKTTEEIRREADADEAALTDSDEESQGADSYYLTGRNTTGDAMGANGRGGRLGFGRHPTSPEAGPDAPRASDIGGRAITDEEQGTSSAFPFVLDSNLWRTVSAGPFDLVSAVHNSSGEPGSTVGGESEAGSLQPTAQGEPRKLQEAPSNRTDANTLESSGWVPLHSRPSNCSILCLWATAWTGTRSKQFDGAFLAQRIAHRAAEACGQVSTKSSFLACLETLWAN